MSLITIVRPIMSSAELHDYRAQRRGRKRAATVLLGVGVLLAAPFVDGGSATAEVVSMPAHTVYKNTSLGATRSLTPVMIGGSTTVPTTATFVQISVGLFRATRAGALTIYPNGRPNGARDAIEFTPGATYTREFLVPVGLQDKVVFRNDSSGSIALTVLIIGYSTEVRSWDISGTDGEVDQVLTNTGEHAAWRYPQAKAFFVESNSSTSINSGYGPVLFFYLDGGTYLVTFSAEVTGSPAGTSNAVKCLIETGSVGSRSRLVTVEASPNKPTTIVVQGIIHVAEGGESVDPWCTSDLNGANAAGATITAVRVSVTS